MRSGSVRSAALVRTVSLIRQVKLKLLVKTIGAVRGNAPAGIHAGAGQHHRRTRDEPADQVPSGGKAFDCGCHSRARCGRRRAAVCRWLRWRRLGIHAGSIIGRMNSDETRAVLTKFYDALSMRDGDTDYACKALQRSICG